MNPSLIVIPLEENGINAQDLGSMVLRAIGLHILFIYFFKKITFFLGVG